MFRLRLSIIEEKKKSKRLVFYCYLLFFPLLHDDPIHNIFVFVQNVTKYLICNQYVPFPNINEWVWYEITGEHIFLFFHLVFFFGPNVYVRRRYKNHYLWWGKFLFVSHLFFLWLVYLCWIFYLLIVRHLSMCLGSASVVASLIKFKILEKFYWVIIFKNKKRQKKIVYSKSLSDQSYA